MLNMWRPLAHGALPLAVCECVCAHACVRVYVCVCVCVCARARVSVCRCEGQYTAQTYRQGRPIYTTDIQACIHTNTHTERERKRVA